MKSVFPVRRVKQSRLTAPDFAGCLAPEDHYDFSGFTPKEHTPGDALLATAPANVRDAIEAMMVLGCRTAVAERAVAMAVEELGGDAKTEQLVRAALKHR